MTQDDARLTKLTQMQTPSIPGAITLDLLLLIGHQPLAVDVQEDCAYPVSIEVPLGLLREAGSQGSRKMGKNLGGGKGD